MEVKRVNSLSQQDVDGLDLSFEVFGLVDKPYSHLAEDGPIRFTPISQPYQKTFEFDEEEMSDARGDEKAIFTLCKSGRIYGFSFASKGWNNMVFFEYITLDASVRGQGHAQRLFDAVIAWARAIGSTGVRVEAQSNNVAACRFYKKMGLIFGGYDELLYKGIPKSAHETAHFWYYLL